jgi:hypothetical protein
MLAARTKAELPNHTVKSQYRINPHRVLPRKHCLDRDDRAYDKRKQQRTGNNFRAFSDKPSLTAVRAGKKKRGCSI